MRTSFDPVRSCAATTDTPLSRDETAARIRSMGGGRFPADVHHRAAQEIDAVAWTAVYQEADKSGQSEINDGRMNHHFLPRKSKRVSLNSSIKVSPIKRFIAGRTQGHAVVPRLREAGTEVEGLFRRDSAEAVDEVDRNTAKPSLDPATCYSWRKPVRAQSRNTGFEARAHRNQTAASEVGESVRRRWMRQDPMAPTSQLPPTQ